MIGECGLCASPGGVILWQDDTCRVVWPQEPEHPGTLRVVAQRHVVEMTDLSRAERAHVMSVVFAVEAAVRTALSPDKVNLASLGNLTPHVHWHVVPRYRDDRHFPGSVWSVLRRRTRPRPADARALARVRAAIVASFGPGRSPAGA